MTASDLKSSGDRFGRCEDCGSRLGRAQRYCLECGTRHGSRSPELIELLRRVGEQREPDRAGGVAAASDTPPTPPVGPERPAHAARRSAIATIVARVSALALPSSRVSALLVLVFLGFGVLLGNVAGSRVDDSLAASARPRLKVILPPTASAASSSSPPAAEATGAEPPASAAEPTPEAPASSTTAPAPAPAPSSGSGSPSGSSGGGSGSEGGSATTPSSASSAKLPAFKHVFVIMLSDQPYAAVFGPSSSAHYLSQTLERRGELLPRYYAVAHEQLAGAIALVSGQGPTPATAANCPNYTEIAPASTGAEGQVAGEGCVYPRTTETLAGQLTTKHLSWRAYLQGMDEPGTAAGPCAHPAIGAPDPSSAVAQSVQSYATFRNPFAYFHALIDSPACAADDVGLNRLSSDLSSAKRTPSFSYIVPDRCHDGGAAPCAGGAPGGLPAADAFLKQTVPKILSSKAYKDGGLLLITVDEAPSSGEFADSSSCCGQPQFPNLPAPTGAAAALGPGGGGQVGALLLSPFVKPGTTSQEQYDHFSLLRTIEDVFALKHIGYAAGAHVKSLEPSLFSAQPHG